MTDNEPTVKSRGDTPWTCPACRESTVKRMAQWHLNSHWRGMPSEYQYPDSNRIYKQVLAIVRELASAISVIEEGENDV